MTDTQVDLPTFVDYPAESGSPWDVFPLGVAAGGSVASWEPAVTSHILIAGGTGLGKSVTQQAILTHALLNPEHWKIVAIDLKMVNFPGLAALSNVLGVTKTLEGSVMQLRTVQTLMNDRFTQMREAGVSNYSNLPEPPPGVLVLIDELLPLVTLENTKTDEANDRDALRAVSVEILGEISRLGRPAGVHLSMATQRPDARSVPGELRNNCDARVACGPMSEVMSMTVLDSDLGTLTPEVKGRAVLRNGKRLTEYQGYFTTGDGYLFTDR